MFTGDIFLAILYIDFIIILFMDIGRWHTCTGNMVTINNFVQGIDMNFLLTFGEFFFHFVYTGDN